MCLFGYASWIFKLQKILGKELLFPEVASCCCLFKNHCMLAGLSSYPKWHFYLSENKRHYFYHMTKIWGKKYCNFSPHFNPKIVGNNRSSEQIFTETVSLGCPWVFAVIRSKPGGGAGGQLTCDQALPLSLITRGEEGLKHSFDGSNVKWTDSDLSSWLVEKQYS